jgi:outer membrane receptor protein involved in Fe transport
MVAIAGFAAMVAFSPQLLAAQSANEEDELEEVQVTGTRIQSPNVTSANPVTSVTAEEMRALGIVNVADALTTLVPQNISTYMPTLVGDNQAGFGGGGMETMDRGSFFIGNTIANLRGLDPSFGSRTLTLIDGRRVPSTSNQADVVDLNTIPSNLLQRVDVVTGGASATYGSGAMAGVVNLVLNNRLEGVNLDVDYSVTERGDGGNPHVTISGGRPFFNGRGHGLLSFEWEKRDAIRNCAAARDWCAESRTMFSNFDQATSFGANTLSTFTPLPGYEGFPARFEMSNVRRSQFAPTGTLYFNNANVTSNLRFNADGTALEEYSLGFRGGTGQNAMNGDGPLATWMTPIRPSTDRKVLFTHFEYDFTERTTGYLEASYSRTVSLNQNGYTTGNYCVRFDSQGTAAQLGAKASMGETITGGGSTWPAVPVVDFDEWFAGNPNPAPVQSITAGSQFSNANFRQWLGWSGGNMPAPGFAAPYWVSGGTTGDYGASGATRTSPPTYTFANGTPIWIHVKNNPPAGNEWWVLAGIVLTADFEDPGTPAQLPGLGRNSYAFLDALTPEALEQVRGAFGSGGSHGAIIDQQTGGLLAGFSSTAGGGSGLDTIYGPSPCQGFTAMRKVWNPQLEQWTHQVQEPWRAVAGLRGRFGEDWRWEVYYQYGRTDSRSRQNNVPTTLRLSFAMDAVIDDRPGSPTYGQPVCRVTRDGVPVIDYQGRPLSDVEALARLAEDCRPINIFGYDYSGYDHFAGFDAARVQQEAIDYAFVESLSKGYNSLQTLSFSLNGTLWEGWAGPLTAAMGLDVREDKVVQGGTQASASYYERADLARAWSDAFGGKTRVTEAFTELNLPLVSGQEGINLWSVNAAVRWSSYRNKGGAGTTGETATTDVLNWKFQTIFEPFDWVRLRLTRSRDLRAPGYRDLFIQQPGLPDQFAGTNPWREYNPYSDEARRERWGQVRVGNPDLDPEKSNTLTLGMVFSPGGWAQGMRVSADYYNIRVKDGITFPFIGSTTANITSCWEGSGNRDPDPGNPDIDAINGLFEWDFYDEALGRYPCREITFATNPDGSRNLQDIVSYNSARPVNSLPYQRRGIDVSLSYVFPLNRIVESLPGRMQFTVRGTRALEASGVQVNSSLQNTQANCEARGGRFDDFNCYIYLDLVGQIRNGTFVPGVQPSPKWVGNIIASYMAGDLTASLSARYIGGAAIDKTWCDNPDCPAYQDENGAYLFGSIDNNRVDPYMNFSLNGSYNLRVRNMRRFEVFGSINNLFDKSPPFTGDGISGASAGYHDIMGRTYRFGVRMQF